MGAYLMLPPLDVYKRQSRDRGVIVVLSGSFQVLSVKINQRLLNNHAKLENSVAEAVDDALQKGIQLLKTEAQKLLGK